MIFHQALLASRLSKKAPLEEGVALSAETASSATADKARGGMLFSVTRAMRFYSFNRSYSRFALRMRARAHHLPDEITASRVVCRSIFNADANRSSCVLIFHLMHRHLPFAGLAPQHQQTRSAVIIVKSQCAPTLRIHARAPLREVKDERRERERGRRGRRSYSMRFSEAMQVNNSCTLRRSLNGR
jgi:hypothetical protein